MGACNNRCHTGKHTHPQPLPLPWYKLAICHTELHRCCSQLTVQRSKWEFLLPPLLHPAMVVQSQHLGGGEIRSEAAGSDE
jgi:hypothetical protein